MREETEPERSMRFLILLLLTPPLTAQTIVSKPMTLPGSVTGTARAITLPRDENLVLIDQRSLRLQYTSQGLTLQNAGKAFRQFDPNGGDAEATKKLLNDLNVMRWGTIGIARPVVEYGLTVDAKGELILPPNAGFPATQTPFELKSLRVEAVKGVWCVRDDQQVLLNFGLERDEARQAVAVAQKYGFNQIATVGKGRTPAVTYFLASLANAPISAPNNAADMQRRQLQVLQRTGVEVPTVGYVGEKITLEPRKLEVRREGAQVSLRMGTDVLARFGGDEWGAREAVRAIEQARYTEFARVGNVNFFLINGSPSHVVPMLARTHRFDPKSLKVKEIRGVWSVVEGSGRALVSATSEKDGQELIRVIQALQFDTQCTIGSSATNSLQFFVKGR